MTDAPETKLTLDGRYTVLTPEYVEFDFVLAGLMSRFLAFLIDTVVSLFSTALLLLLVALLAGALSVGGSKLFGLGFGEAVGGIGAAATFVIWFLVDWGYMIVFETAWSGQTIGKRVLGLRVLQDSGVRVSVQASLLRNLVRPLDKLPLFYLVGGLATLASRSQQRLGDLLAGTIVVRERKLKIPSQLERPEGDTSLLKDAEFLGRVHQLSQDDEALLLSAAIRREELGMDARLNLFATLAKRLEVELGIEKPEHLSDEKLVMLVTAALVARKAAKAPGTRRFLR